MPRSPRIQAPGASYHVTARGNDGGAVFRDDQDRRLFLSMLGRVVGRYEWTCHAYCLMTTHLHLLLTTGDPNLAAGMQRLNGSYAQTFNARRDRSGHLFQGRYHSVLVESHAHLLELYRYIALNPVRAGACRRPVDWPWSSYPAAVGFASSQSFSTDESLLVHFGDEPTRARSRLRRFVEDDAGELILQGR
jgi:putative transposase